MKIEKKSQISAFEDLFMMLKDGRVCAVRDQDIAWELILFTVLDE